ncbi:MAG: hypothetical protein QM769_03195 [Pseudoxanthomonas sp.]
MSASLESFRRIRGDCLVDRFYELFLSSDERIRAMFVRTDLARQKQMLLFGLLVVLGHSDGEPTASRALNRLSERHRELGVPAAMYDAFMSCMLRSAAELDPEWSPAVEQDWRRALTAGIAVMQLHAPK